MEFVKPAPTGILRAAAWPIETLAGFGSAELAKLALDVGDLSGRCLNQTYIALWRETVEQERQQLWQVTADDPRFLKALLFSNPALYRRVRRYATRRLGSRSKRMRRLERTLYRFLARAVGRTTPMGLWAGVTTVTFADAERQQGSSARYAVSPDLRPFQFILRDLSNREHYREAALWRLSPTLHSSEHGGWEFWARLPGSRIVRRRMDHDVAVEALIDTLCDGICGTFAELSRRVAESTSWQANSARWGTLTIRALLETLAEGGALVGGLDLPSRFSSPWNALEIAQADLEESDRRHWATTLNDLRTTCAKMSDRIDRASPEQVERLMADASAQVHRLAKALNVRLPDSDYPALRCDLGLPFDVSCDWQQRRYVLETVQAYESCWLDGLSPGTMWRRAHYSEKRRNIEPGACLGSIDRGDLAPSGWHELETSDDPDLRARINAWQDTICVEADEVTLHLPKATDNPGPAVPSAPLGCLYVGLNEDFQLAVHGLSDDAATSFARYHDALGSTEAITSWLSQCLQRLETTHGIEIAELTSPFERSPNALARPILVHPIIDPWGTEPNAVTLAGAEVRLDPHTRLPFLQRPGQERPTAVFWFASANIALTDPVARQLLETTFHESVVGSFQALTLPVRGELDLPRFAPRVKLPCGAVIRRRRTVVNGARLRLLASRSPWQRYVHWQHLAVEQGWPDLVSVSFAGQTPLLMKCSSPLALEALFKGARNCDGDDFMIVEEFAASPWLKGAGGERYVAELALPFARPEHGWSVLRAAPGSVGGEQMP